METRRVQPGDIPAVSAIYNHFVLNSTCTFAVEPEGPAYWRDWLAAHTGARAALVAVEGGEVLGWGTLSRWNSRCAYNNTVEDSVYVADGCHRRGIGRAILSELISLARHHNLRSIIAQIADHQAPSVRLHQAHGFEPAGCLRGVGYKFDRWIDVDIWQLQLESSSTGPAQHGD